MEHGWKERGEKIGLIIKSHSLLTWALELPTGLLLSVTSGVTEKRKLRVVVVVVAERKDKAIFVTKSFVCFFLFSGE